VSLIHELLQSFTDDGKLCEKDFDFCEKPLATNDSIVRRSSISVRGPADLSKFQVSDNYDSKLPIRFLVTPNDADSLTSPEQVKDISRIERDTGILVHVREDIQRDRPYVEIEGCNGRKCEFVGDILKRIRLSQKNDEYKLQYLVPVSRSKYIVGVRGQTISTIQAAAPGSHVKFATGDSSQFGEWNILEISSASLESVIAATRLVISKLDYTIYEDEKHRVDLDPKSREPLIGAGTIKRNDEAQDTTLLQTLGKFFNTCGDMPQKISLYMTHSDLDYIEPELARIEAELGPNARLRIERSSLVVHGHNRAEVLTAISSIMDVLGGRQTNSADSQSARTDDDVVDYEY
jgi:hypothetical protein